MIRVSDSIVLDEGLIDERFVRASGPGGQNVNKVATAVELRFDLHHAPLPADMKARVRARAANQITTDGVLVIDSRVHRTQAQNRVAARERLVGLLQRAARKPKTRRATLPSQASREKRLADKKHRTAVKSARGKPSGQD
jgi:ribosome-associated protein